MIYTYIVTMNKDNITYLIIYNTEMMKNYELDGCSFKKIEEQIDNVIINPFSPLHF